MHHVSPMCECFWRRSRRTQLRALFLCCLVFTIWELLISHHNRGIYDLILDTEFKSFKPPIAKVGRRSLPIRKHQNYPPRVVCLEDDIRFLDNAVVAPKRTLEVDEAEEFPSVYRLEPLPVDRSSCEPVDNAAKTMVQHPTCNDFHMQNMAILLSRRTIAKGNSNNKKKFGLDKLGAGGWRIAWKLRQQKSRETVVLKTLKFHDQAFDYHTYLRQMTDAIVTEVKTSKSSILDMYGFCGMSVYNELADMALTKALPTTPFSPNKPEWLSAWEQRLHFAQSVSRAVADLHENPSTVNVNFPVFVHRDLKTDNFVLVKGSGTTVKLNDMNDAEIMWRNTTTTDGSPCLFRRRRWSPYYKSPEEARELGLTAAVDVYALGGVLFRIVTGRRPYHGLGRYDAFRVLLREGHDTIPDKFRKSQYTLEIMRLIESMWQRDPKHRPSAYQVASTVDRIVSNLYNHNNNGTTTTDSSNNHK